MEAIFSAKNFYSFIVSLLLITLMMTRANGRAAPLDDGDAVDDKGDGRDKRETFDMIDLLSTYGYLPKNEAGLKGQLMSDYIVTDAIRSFQQFNGLKATGIPDQETIQKMQAPRCGYPDILQADGAGDTKRAFDSPDDPQAFSTLGSRWRKDTVYWKPTQFTNKLERGQQWTAFQRALDLWEEVIPLKFQYSNSRPDMEIKFAKGDHGDGWRNRFNGRGGVLAHAYGPGEGIGGDTHFDEDEEWTMNTGQGTDLTNVAAHEFGHALGLGHSNVPGALMAPYYRYMDELSLHQDDVQGIQRIYGPKGETTTTEEPSTTTTTATTTTTTPTTTTTKKTTTTTDEMPPWIPHFCKPNFKLDAISEGPDGYLYAYRQYHIYKIGTSGLESGFPKYITDVFPRAPRRYIKAVTFAPTTGKTFMFKGSRVWRFTGFELDPGFPKRATHSHIYQPSSAITLTHSGASQFYLFGENYFWEWNPDTERIVPGYPLSSRVYFPSAPTLPDASYMNRHGNVFFFKDNKLMKLRHRGSRAVSYALGSSLFGPICGIDTDHPDILNLESPAAPAAPQMPPVKYDEAMFDTYPAKPFEVAQPDSFDSSMIKSLLISQGEAAMREALETVRLEEEEDDNVDDYLSWATSESKAPFDKSRGSKSKVFRRIGDALKSYPNY